MAKDQIIVKHFIPRDTIKNITKYLNIGSMNSDREGRLREVIGLNKATESRKGDERHLSIMIVNPHKLNHYRRHANLAKAKPDHMKLFKRILSIEEMILKKTKEAPNTCIGAFLFIH